MLLRECQVHGVEVPAWAADAQQVKRLRSPAQRCTELLCFPPPTVYAHAAPQQVVERAAAVEVTPFTPKENVRIETGERGWLAAARRVGVHGMQYMQAP